MDCIIINYTYTKLYTVGMIYSVTKYHIFLSDFTYQGYEATDDQSRLAHTKGWGDVAHVIRYAYEIL